ncbi:MAG: serine/threonine protein kinase [Planctomycetes bacterium]|nr:serine/threonine protein kinase [Planctomycetota bacterium]MCB9920449.1 serine/threonine protein kinase [Planctomycetota bacterium]
MESEVARILEECFSELLEGREPDIEALCAHAPHLRARVSRVVAREREVLGSAHSKDDPLGDDIDVDVVASGTLVNRRVGDFEILEEIGSGGMGKVYRARQLSLNREVALKILREDLSDSAAGRTRMQREALITAALEHENIVPVYATGQDGDRTFIAMKLVRGLPLDQQALPLDPIRTAKIGLAVARALQAAHEVGVLHRDMKPANVLLASDTPYVVDFGLARLATRTTQLTQGHAAPGTLAYMAPEMLRERAPTFDPRVDVYGLGATLYETLSGNPPFWNDNQIRLLREVLYDEPKRLSLPSIHGDLETIVLRALQKSPTDRFLSAGAMAEELERFLRGEPIESKPVGIFGRIWRRARRRPAFSLTVTAVACVVITMSAVLVRSRMREADRRNFEIARIEAGLTDPDLTDATARLEQLRSSDEFAAPAELTTRLRDEATLRVLTLILQHTLVHTNPGVAAELAQHLRNAKDARARIAVAAWEALGRASKRLDLDVDLTARYPRTTCVRDALDAGDDVAARLEACSEDGGATDRLFVVFLLRLNDQPTHLSESELRTASTTGPEGLAVQFARAAVLEELSEERAAFLELGPLLGSKLMRPFALCTRARLAATLGYDDARRRLVEVHELVGPDAPEHLRAFLAGARLQIARDLGQGTEFWRVWESAAPLLDKSHAYWMFGADTARRSGDLERARALLIEGVDKVHKRPMRDLALRSSLLQVDWLRKPYSEEPEPLVGDELAQFRPEIEDLDHRASELYLDAQRVKVRLVMAEAIVARARCARALGNRREAWNLLEHACREYQTPEALSYYAFLIAYRVLNRHLTGSPDEDESSTPLVQASGIAFERAGTVLRSAKSGEPAALDVQQMTRLALFASAYHCGYVDETIEMARHILDRPVDEDDYFAMLATHAIEWGGFPLDVLLEEAADFEALAQRLITAVEIVEASRLTRDQRRAAYERWSQALEGAASVDGASWRAARAVLAKALAESAGIPAPNSRRR